MSDNENETIYFAKTDFRGKEQRFGIKAKDRTRHVYIVGKTGMGKSTLLENMAAQDIINGNGIAFIDPHGSAVETLLRYVPKERIKDVIYFAPFDMDHPISFNIMEDVGYDKRHLVVSGLMGAFKKIWQDQWSSRMEYILTNTLLALVEYPESTLLDINTMLINKDFRKKVLEHVTDPIVKSFWVDEFAKYTDRYTQEATPAIQNKIGQFVSNPIIRNIVGQPKASFDFRKAMDEKKIVIMNLSKGRMGEQNADLIGSMLVVKIYLAAMSRADLSPAEIQKKPNFYFYVDEFQSFANETFSNILSEARKYKLNLTIAHQYIEQMPEEVRSAVFGNVGTMIFFRVGAIDADIIEKELAPTFTAENLVSLGIYQIYLKLMIDGLTSTPFSATTLPPIDISEKTYVDEVIDFSRERYSQPRAKVEEMIRLGRESLQEGFKSTSNPTPKPTSNPTPKPTSKPTSKPTPKPTEENKGHESNKGQGGNGGNNPQSPQSNSQNKDHRSQSEDTSHTPFKKIFSKEVSSKEVKESANQKNDQKPVSLDSLNPNIKKNAPSVQQGQSSKNASALRDVLAKALEESAEKNGNNNTVPDKKSTPEAPIIKSQNKPDQDTKKTIPEVPESKLRKTLDI